MTRRSTLLSCSTMLLHPLAGTISVQLGAGLLQLEGFLFSWSARDMSIGIHILCLETQSGVYSYP